MYIHYKDEPVNAVEGEKNAVHFEAYEHCVGRMQSFYVTASCTYSNHYVLKR